MNLSASADVTESAGIAVLNLISHRGGKSENFFIAEIATVDRLLLLSENSL